METTSRSRNRQKENEKGKKEKALFPEKREGIGSERGKRNTTTAANAKSFGGKRETLQAEIKALLSLYPLPVREAVFTHGHRG